MPRQRVFRSAEGEPDDRQSDSGFEGNAESHGYLVPAEWVFEGDGYSGAILIRPGLEAIRDLAAQGHIEAVLVYSPDRLSQNDGLPLD